MAARRKSRKKSPTMQDVLRKARQAVQRLRDIEPVEGEDLRDLRTPEDREALRLADQEGRRLSKKTLVFANDDKVLTRRMG